MIKKMPVLHNVYLKFFWLKNTISCGWICPQTKPVVFLGFACEQAVLPEFRPCFAAAEP
jgi:hypothetical protein